MDPKWQLGELAPLSIREWFASYEYCETELLCHNIVKEEIVRQEERKHVPV